MDGTDDTCQCRPHGIAIVGVRCEGNWRKQRQLYLNICTCKEMEILSPPQTHLKRGIDIRLIAG